MEREGGGDKSLDPPPNQIGGRWGGGLVWRERGGDKSLDPPPIKLAGGGGAGVERGGEGTNP